MATLTQLRIDKSKQPSSRITVEGSGAVPHCFRGNATVYRVAVFLPDGSVADLSDHASLNLAYMPETRADDAVALSSSAIKDATFTLEEWTNGTKWHAEFSFDEADMNPVIVGLSQKFWLVCYGILTATGYEITHGGSSLMIEEDGTANTVETPPGPEQGVTASQVQAYIDAALLLAGVAKHKTDATAAPTAGDDSGDGYSVGSLWMDVSADDAWLCVDSTEAAAVWLALGPPALTLHKLDAEAAPTAGDDSGDGYSVGSLWIDVSADAAWLCVDATATAAVWLALGPGSAGTLHKLDATAAPTAGDDSGDGYSAGSLWIDVSANVAWICVDATEAAAIWAKITPRDIVEDTSPQLGGPLDANAHQIREAKGADVASAAELPLLADGNYFSVTGTTTITSLATLAVGTRVTLRFAGILTLTHHSTNLILPTAANIATAAGDIATFREYASGGWVCESYQRADGTPLSGGSGGGAPGPLALVDHSSTSGRALTLADANKLHSGWTGSGEGSLPIELTVPQQSVVPWPVGTVLWFRHTDLGDWDFTVANGTSVSGADLTIAVNETVALAMIATNTWTVLYRWSSGA